VATSCLLPHSDSGQWFRVRGSEHLVADEALEGGGVELAVGVAEGAVLGEGVEVLQRQPYWEALQALPPTPANVTRVREPREEVGRVEGCGRRGSCRGWQEELNQQLKEEGAAGQVAGACAEVVGWARGRWRL
jgi:hypothetical protein